MQGEKLGRHTTYNELQVFVRGHSGGGLRGSDSKVFACPVHLFPNFAAFVDALNLLKQPLLREGE
jgi:hypothetical protein